MITPQPLGRPAFIDAPRCADLGELEADFAILGVPYGHPYTLDAVSGPSAGAPDAIREASTHYASGDITFAHHDFDVGGPLFGEEMPRVVDCGAVAMTPGDFAGNSAATTAAVGAILDRGAAPIVLGGDHAIPIPVLRAFDGRGDLCVVQIDAHIDWREERHGVREGLRSPVRRASEPACVTGIAQLGMRGMGSARPPEVRDALDWGAVLITAAEIRERGVDAALATIPAADRYYITVDADGLDAAIAPAVLDPGFGGLAFHEASAILRGVARKGVVVGYDVVEVVPARDPIGLTTACVARLTLLLMGEVWRARQER